MTPLIILASIGLGLASVHVPFRVDAWRQRASAPSGVEGVL